ncbi:ATP-dependent DNA helicase like [Actinidia chinensis var. chinensis]|uniref:DNA helicase n=1 Tax=Actinidia chinensis var. chinensis TaxID=1590841 RepID=A0A2R6RV43_ACTCC|nr:ATP-dependent DNA helicase like [Actinidia chinensis var. chinensis]
MAEFEDALVKQRANCMSGFGLAELRDNRLQTHIQHRLSELEELPSSRGEDLQSKCLLELYGLKLEELQSKVRSDVSSEYWLRLHCAYPDKQLFDWGMMRLRRPMYGLGDAFAMEADENLKKKRDAERLSRLQEEEKNLVETRKRKFFAELLNAARELQLQVQAAQKRRKQRNDGVQAWHGRQRQRATRAEKLRFQALKADDQEAYMKMVEESKNERLTMLLGKTNDLLVRLGAAVQRQKDSEHDGIEPLKDSDAELPELSASKSGTPGDSLPEEDADIVDTESSHGIKTGDLLEGQRQYNSVIHSIQEKVTEQPSMLQGGELRNYQLEGLQWMLSLFNNNLNGILADEMGLGKTIQTISLIAYLLESKGVTGPHLIVAPKAVLPNWVNEFSTWAPSIVAILYDGRLDERKAMREEYSGEGKFNVLITHYDLIMRDKAFLKKIHWHYMIVDEGHRLKNHECALARTLVSGYRIRRRLLLTGTPIQNSLQELWSLLNFLLPTIFNSVENFEEWFNAPFADRCDVSLTDEEELLVIRRLHHVIRPFILRRKKDEVEKFLPGKRQVILKCDMSAWQKVYYHQVTDVGRVGLGTGGKSKSLQNLSMQLRKCCNHPYLFVGEYNMWRKEEIIRASGKFELLDRLLPKLRKAGHRVLLFSQMTRLMDILEIYLQLHDYKYMRLDGSTKTEERGTLLKQFNAPDSPFFMFLLSTRAGGLGLNLQTADTVIIFDSDWNPQMDQQAEDRAHRIGQKKEVRVFVLVSVGSIEEVILERAKQKMGIDAKVIQAGLFNTTSTAQDRREMLEEIMRKGTSSLGTDVPSEREINRLAARSDEEFWLFEKMDDERRQKENYRSRLMEEHEVPDWAYTAPDNKEKGKGFDYESRNITGKRRRKEVVYMDTLSDLQWMKAVENGEDITRHSIRGKRRENLPVKGDDVISNSAGERKELEVKSENMSVASEATSEDTESLDLKRSRSEVVYIEKSEPQGVGESGWNVLSWKPHKRKRSSLAS